MIDFTKSGITSRVYRILGILLEILDQRKILVRTIYGSVMLKLILQLLLILIIIHGYNWWTPIWVMIVGNVNTTTKGQNNFISYQKNEN